MAEGQLGTFSIREAQPTDLPQVIDAARQTWEMAYAHILSPCAIQSVLRKEYSLENLERQLHSTTHILYVAVWDDRVVGYAGCHRRTQEGKLADLTHLYIRPDFQRRGIGKMLLEAVTTDLNRAGVSDVRTLVAKANIPALGFYQQLGFSSQKDYVTFLGDQMVEVIEMAIPLSRLRREQQPGADQPTS